MIWVRRSILSFLAASEKGDVVSLGFRYGRCLGCLFFSKSADGKRRKRIELDTLEFPFFTYTLDNDSGTGNTKSTPSTLYIPFTSFCNTKTLPETRGPKFKLPPGVVSTLLRVRDLECEDENMFDFWCAWLDMCETNQHLPLPSEFSRVSTIFENPEIEHRPTVEELINEIEWRLEQAAKTSFQGITTIVVAGEGEPTMRLNDLMEFIECLRLLNRRHQPIQLRILTNGLLSARKTQRLLNVCCQHSSLPIEFSVALMTFYSKQYNELMEPLLPKMNKKEDDKPEPSSHTIVKQFIKAVVARIAENHATLSLEVTAVDRPDVNTKLTNQLAKSLGVSKPIRWRRYFK